MMLSYDLHPVCERERERERESKRERYTGD